MKSSDSKSHVPEYVYVQAPVVPGGVTGGYIRRSEDIEGFPAYRRDLTSYPYKDQDMFLWHSEVTGMWSFSNDLSNRHAFVCPIDYSSSLNVTEGISFPVIRNGATIVENIGSITWDNAEPDPSCSFCDFDFPTNLESLGIKWAGAEVQWIRALDLNREKKAQLFDEIHPNDCCQGTDAGNCWLIAAITCLAEFPHVFDWIFNPDEVSKEGKYSIKLYNVGESSWVTIVIDDWIPCKPRTWWQPEAVPLYAEAGEDSLWVILLEKAFAKYLGSYWNLEGGTAPWAWQALTGDEEQIAYIRKKVGARSGWMKYSVDLEAQRRLMAEGKLKSLPWQRVHIEGAQNILDMDGIFLVIQNGDLMNYCMSAEIQSSIASVRDDGLDEDHAYSLLEAIQVGDIRLVKLRDPWCDKEWTGAWSDNSVEWEMHAEVSKAAGHQHNSNDGLFWMSIQDFTRIFTHIYIMPYALKCKRDAHSCVKTVDVVRDTIGIDMSCESLFLDEKLFRCLEMFKCWDENQDGVISEEEFGSAISVIAPGYDQGKISKIFAAADTNKDGVIQYKEFLTWIFHDGTREDGKSASKQNFAIQKRTSAQENGRRTGRTETRSSSARKEKERQGDQDQEEVLSAPPSKEEASAAEEPEAKEAPEVEDGPEVKDDPQARPSPESKAVEEPEAKEAPEVEDGPEVKDDPKARPSPKAKAGQRGSSGASAKAKAGQRGSSGASAKAKAGQGRQGKVGHAGGQRRKTVRRA